MISGLWELRVSRQLYHHAAYTQGLNLISSSFCGGRCHDSFGVTASCGRKGDSYYTRPKHTKGSKVRCLLGQIITREFSGLLGQIITREFSE